MAAPISGQANDGHQADTLAIGLMSGTSLDGIDAVVLQCDRPIAVQAAASQPLSTDLQTKLLQLATAQPWTIDRGDPIELLGIARRELTDQYARMIDALPAALVQQVRVIGAHGQTIRHRPEHGFTLQLLDGARLATLTGLPVACDLRSGDVASGGQGAPLVPAFHSAAFADQCQATDARPVAVANIGGIANVSIIGTGGRVIAGFDTGPGNRLLDDWYQKHQRVGSFDRDGQWAASGQCDPDLLTQMLADPYFALPAPKSTGREDFNLDWLGPYLAGAAHARSGADVQATLAELTAHSLARACNQFNVVQILLCGGGARNSDLVRRIAHCAERMPGTVSCHATDSLGIPAQQVEAAAFAWLGIQRWRQQAVGLSAATGARCDGVAGALYLPPHARVA